MSTSLTHEASWWGDCANTFHEEQKQLVYARLLRLELDWTTGHPPTIDLQGRSVIDIGGGPTSLLLKCVNGRNLTVVDPCEYPGWVCARYDECGIKAYQERGEDFTSKMMPDPRFERAILFDERGFVQGYDAVKHFDPAAPTHPFDECWIYNVLQHTEDPEEVVRNARRLAGTVRLLEWVDVGADELHPHVLTEADLNYWLDDKGTVRFVNTDGAVGWAYFGVFPSVPVQSPQVITDRDPSDEDGQ